MVYKYIYSVKYKPKNNYFNLKIVYDIRLRASHTARKARAKRAFVLVKQIKKKKIISKNKNKSYIFVKYKFEQMFKYS